MADSEDTLTEFPQCTSSTLRYDEYDHDGTSTDDEQSRPVSQSSQSLTNESCISSDTPTASGSSENNKGKRPALEPLNLVISSKRCKPGRGLGRLTAQSRALQFSDDFYEDGGILFCRFCIHSVDFTRMDTVKDHLKSKTHTLKKQTAKKRSIQSLPPLKQKTLTSTVNSNSLRNEFIMDFLSMLTIADIPIHRADKIRPFTKKYCKQGGTIPGISTLRNLHLPRLYEKHFKTLKEKIAGKKLSLIVDETTDCRDKSILNIIGKVRDTSYLLDVVSMKECNHRTLSQSVIKCVGNFEICYENVVSFVTDSAAYCKKSHKDVLANIFTNSVHVLCLAHIVNLVAEVFSHWKTLDNIAQLVSFVKSAFFKKPGRKSRYLDFIAEFVSADQAKLPPVPVATRWNSWFEAVIYHSKHVQLYHGFFSQEKSQGMAVERILDLVDDSRLHRTDFLKLRLNLKFVEENCRRIMAVLTSLEATSAPLAPTVFNAMEDFRSYLSAGATKTSFGTETDSLLQQLSGEERDEIMQDFNDLFENALFKFNKHLNSHPVMPYYKAVRIFDPRQLASLSKEIENYAVVPELASPSNILLEEFQIYTNLQPDAILQPFDLKSFWDVNRSRFEHLSAVAMEAIWMPVTSIDVERSFSMYKHILNDRRERLSEENTKKLTLLYVNGDIEGRFDEYA